MILQKTKKFSVVKAAKLSRVGNKSRAILNPLELKGKSTEIKVGLIAKEVLKRIPFDQFKYSSSMHAEGKRIKESIASKAAKSLSKKRSIGYFHCVERCNAALGLLRKAGVKCWIARQVYFELNSGRFKIHDYVEFFDGGKVRTLGFGISADGLDFFKVFNHSADHFFSGVLGNNKHIFRGVEGSQIGGASSYKKLKQFLRNPLSLKELGKDARRIELLVKAGLIPSEAVKQFG
jgi:hypothetical protein